MLLSPAQGFGYLALTFGLACFAQTDDQRFKRFMALECLAYVLHFALLGHPMAVASNLVSLARSVAAMRARTPPVGLFFIGLSLTFGAGLYQGWMSLLPILASCIGTTALFFLHGLRMRLLMLGGTALWLLNNLLVGSIGSTLLEATLLLTNGWALWRLWNRAAASAPGAEQ